MFEIMLSYLQRELSTSRKPLALKTLPNGSSLLAFFACLLAAIASLRIRAVAVIASHPQICYHVNRACGFMSNPSHSVNAYAKQIALHLYQYPIAVKWGGLV